MGVVAAAAEIQLPCSDAAVMPCRTATLFDPGPVAAPAVGAADKMTMDPAVPAAIKVPALSRVRQLPRFKVGPPR